MGSSETVVAYIFASRGSQSVKENLSFGDEELGLSHSSAYEDLRTFIAHVCNMSSITCHESASCSDINVP